MNGTTVCFWTQFHNLLNPLLEQLCCCWPRRFSRISGGWKSSYIVSSRVFPDKDSLCLGIIVGLIWPSGVSNFSHGVLCVFASANLFSGWRGDPAEQRILCCFQNLDSYSSHFSVFWYLNVQPDTLCRKAESQNNSVNVITLFVFFKILSHIFLWSESCSPHQFNLSKKVKLWGLGRGVMGDVRMVRQVRFYAFLTLTIYNRTTVCTVYISLHPVQNTLLCMASYSHFNQEDRSQVWNNIYWG